MTNQVVTKNNEVIKNKEGVNEMVNRIKGKKLIGKINKNNEEFAEKVIKLLDEIIKEQEKSLLMEAIVMSRGLEKELRNTLKDSENKALLSVDNSVNQITNKLYAQVACMSIIDKESIIEMLNEIKNKIVSLNQEYDEKLIKEELLKGSEIGKRFIDTDIYYDLIEEFKVEVFNKALIVVENCYLDTTTELEVLNSITGDLPEYHNFYEDILDEDTKIEIEDDLMNELSVELLIQFDDTKSYIAGYEGFKVKLLLNSTYYYENLEDFENECYENIKFVTNE